MDMKKIHTKEELEKGLVSDRDKMTFMLRQAAETMKMLGVAGIEQTVSGYTFKITTEKEES